MNSMSFIMDKCNIYGFLIVLSWYLRAPWGPAAHCTRCYTTQEKKIGPFPCELLILCIAFTRTTVSLDFSSLYADKVYCNEKNFKGTVIFEVSDGILNDY